MLRVRSIPDAARRSGWNSLSVARWAVVSSRGVHHGRSRDIGPSRQRLVPHSVCLAAGRARVTGSRTDTTLPSAHTWGSRRRSLIHDSLVVADGKNLPEKRRKAEMNLGSAGLTACGTT